MSGYVERGVYTHRNIVQAYDADVAQVGDIIQNLREMTRLKVLEKLEDRVCGITKKDLEKEFKRNLDFVVDCDEVAVVSCGIDAICMIQVFSSCSCSFCPNQVRCSGTFSGVKSNAVISWHAVGCVRRTPETHTRLAYDQPSVHDDPKRIGSILERSVLQTR